MRSWVVLPLLACICAVSQLTHAQKKCDLSGKKDDEDFPDLEKIAVESYQMSVEYTLPKAGQTDFFTEYYSILDRQGRVDSQIGGQTFQFIYATASWEAWEVYATSCTLQNVTTTPELFEEDQSDWLYIGKTDNFRIIGPSAMFKIALEVWNGKSRNEKMGYMGESDVPIRGLKAWRWRRCQDDGSYVDYYFAKNKEESAHMTKMIPLRVVFGGDREGKEREMSDEVYDIMDFLPFIPSGVNPFDLPKGKGCKRGDLAERPDLPNFQNRNLMFNAEVIYRKIDRSGDDAQYWSYYSTLKMAFDETTQHLAYQYAPWKSKKTDDVPDVDYPEFVVYDMKHHYVYKTLSKTGQCEIIRQKSFYPQYVLPEDGGAVSLTDPSILFPNSEPQYLSEGTNRGLRVDIFEEVLENYVLDAKDGGKITIPNAVITRSYLQSNEVDRNLGSVKNALTQIQLRFSGRIKDVTEILTFNFFGFSTEISNRRSIFSAVRCFRNFDDYVWVTLGFNVDPDDLAKIQDDIPSIQKNVLNSLTMSTELNAVRIPIILVDFSDRLVVSMLILGKPPVLLDYLDPKEGKVVLEGAEVGGLMDEKKCATECLEQQDNCWGFSICGAVCTYGTGDVVKVGDKQGCKLFTRFDNATFIPSKELMIENLRRKVQEHEMQLVLIGADDKPVQVEASSIEVTDPGETNRMFDRIGNPLNPRMRVLKTGAKLKNTAGSEVKDMGILRYDDCQKLCLDFKDCESASYCLKPNAGSQCLLTSKYGDDIKKEDIEEDNMCNLITRKYADNFQRSPGVVLSLTAREVLNKKTAEQCAQACLTAKDYKCLSFDHCPTDEEAPCKLHVVHYPNAETRETIQKKDTNCGHYFRKFSTEFKKSPERKTVGSTMPPLTSVTLEECSKDCFEYGNGICYGFDFCQGKTIYQSTCTLLDKEVSTYKMVENKMCVNFVRDRSQAPIPESKNAYSNSYAGGIGFLCFVVGAVLGALIVFGIAYLRVNRR